MYVFFDKNGDIKAISPSLSNMGEEFLSATFPLAEVEPFLNSTKSTFDYQIRKIKSTYKIVKKERIVKYTKTLETYLTKVSDIETNNKSLIFVNDIVHKVVSVELDKSMLHDIQEVRMEDGEHISDALFNSGPCIAYLTKKNNPYHLLFTFTFSPESLLTTDKLYFNYEGVYNDTSVYTKKHIGGYFFKEKTE